MNAVQVWLTKQCNRLCLTEATAHPHLCWSHQWDWWGKRRVLPSETNHNTNMRHNTNKKALKNILNIINWMFSGKLIDYTWLQTSCHSWWGPNLRETSHHRAAKAACRSAAGGWPALELPSGFLSLFLHALSPYWRWSRGPLSPAGPSSGLQSEPVKLKSFSRTNNMDTDEFWFTNVLLWFLYQ